MSGSSRRVPQQNRSHITRRRLLEAAIECLAERGWGGTTVAVVAERAGVSRGAAQHYFPTREDLVVAAIEHMAMVRVDEIRRDAAELPSGQDRTEAIVEMLVRHYTGPLFRAALQLWVAASGDAALRAHMIPLEATVGREAHAVALELLDVDEAVPGVRETVQATLDMARGLGLAGVLADDSARRAPIVRQWARMLDTALSQSSVPGDDVRDR